MPLVQHGMLNMEVFWSIVMGVCASVITISSALGVLMSVLKKFKAPEVSQNEEIKEIKLEVAEIKKVAEHYKALVLSTKAQNVELKEMGQRE